MLARGGADPTTPLVGDLGRDAHGEEADGQVLLAAERHRQVVDESIPQQVQQGATLASLVEERRLLVQAAEKVALVRVHLGKDAEIEEAQVGHTQGTSRQGVGL